MPPIEALKLAHVEAVLLPVLVQLIVIILAARLAATLFRKLGQSGVVGEIAVGLILGPSLLGQIPAVHQLFHPAIDNVPPELADQVFRWIFTILAQLGLILMLFLVGLDVDFSHLQWHGPAALAISLTGIVIPFGLGIAIAPLLLASPDLGVHPAAVGPPPFWHFALFLGVALAITALPVLARLLFDLNIQRTKLGAVGITAAAVDDAMGWILLATVAAVVNGAQRAAEDVSLAPTFIMLAQTLGFAVVMIFGVRPLVPRLTPYLMKDETLSVMGLAILLCAVLTCAILTNLIGIFAIFGAFLLGAVLSAENALREAVAKSMRDFVATFFMPIFFTYTGLRTEVQSLGSVSLWLLCGLVLAAAIVGKFGGCFLAALATGFSRRESAAIGAMMNTRGLMELVVINVGYDLRVIPKSVFAMLVIMALVTTVMATPLLARFLRGTEYEKDLKRSPLMTGQDG